MVSSSQSPSYNWVIVTLLAQGILSAFGTIHGYLLSKVSSPRILQYIKLVAKLIILGTRLWNRHLLHALFDHQTASSIQQIHLSVSPTEDTAIWAKSPSGKFSVKSAYLADQEVRFTPSGPLSKKAWSKLWALKINERLKLFL